MISRLIQSWDACGAVWGDSGTGRPILSESRLPPRPVKCGSTVASDAPDARPATLGFAGTPGAERRRSRSTSARWPRGIWTTLPSSPSPSGSRRARYRCRRRSGSLHHRCTRPQLAWLGCLRPAPGERAAQVGYGQLQSLQPCGAVSLSSTWWAYRGVEFTP